MYTWVIPLKENNVITVTNDFEGKLNECDCRPSKIAVDNDSGFYNRSMKSFLQNNNIEIYSTQNLLLLKDLFEP